MAAGDVALNLIVSATTGAAMSALQGLGKGISDMVGGGAMGKLAEGSIAAGVAIVGIGVAAVKSAGDFQQSMTLLVTSAGESNKAISAVSAGILKMSVDTGTSTAQLAKGMYYIESAGYHGANGLNVLKTAAMGAKTENADLDTVAKALTTVLVDYGMKSTDSAKAMNGLIATVQNGKTNLQELASSMGAVLPIASAMHISFPQVAGAMATMTNAGMSARQAAQNLAHVLIALQSPSGVAVGSMQAVGLKAEDVKNALVNKGLPQALQLIEDHVGKKFPAGSVLYETALKNIMGGIVGLKLAAMLTGPSLQATKDNIDKISAAMKDGSGAVMGWTDIQGNFNFKIDQAKEALNVFMIALGTRLIPIVSQVIGAVTPIITAFSSWISKTDMLGGVTSAFSKILAMSGVDFTRLTGATKFLFLNGLLPLGDAIQKVGGLVGQILMGAFKALLPVIGQFANTVLPQMIATFNLLFHDIDQVATEIVNFFTKTQAGSAILQVAGGVMATALSAVVTIMGQLWYGAEQVIIAIGDVANFFKKNEVAALALLIPLGAISAILVQMAVTAIVAFIAAIPAVIAGFVAWAVAAGAAAVATIAATWPILAIGAAIGLVVAGIILAVQHWGAISKWLEGAWANTVTFFAGIWSAIVGFFVGVGKWFQDRFTEASNGIKAGFGAVGAFFTGIWNGITNAVTSFVKGVQSIFTGVIAWIGNAWKVGVQAVVGSFVWLYNHNYYVKDLVDFITHIFTVGLAWIKNAWTVSVNWLVGIWQGLTHIATVAWNAVTGAINVAVTAVSKAVQIGWTASVTWLTLQWNNLKTLAADAWKRVGDLFSSIWTTYIVHPLTLLWTNISSWWNTGITNTTTFTQNMWVAVAKIVSTAWTNYIVKPLTSLWTNISTWFGTLATNFGTWASNALAQFVAGIVSGAKNVLTAVSNLGLGIAKLLGFHSPPVSGPLSASDQWMPNMVTMMANGITSNSPKVTTATTNMATGVNNQFTNMNNQVGTSVNNLNNTVNSGFQNMSSNVASNSNNINNSMNGLQSNVSSKSSAINSSIAGMSTGAIANLNNLNGEVQNVSSTVPKAMTTVGSSVQQVTPVIQGATIQWTQNMVNAGQIVASNSKTAVSVVSAAAASIPQYAEAFQKGTGEMSSSASEGMSKANQSMTTGAKQATGTQNGLMSTLKGGFDTMAKFGADFEQKNQTMLKNIADGASQALGNFTGNINDMVKVAEDGAKSIAASIASMLGHSTPTIGPLKGDDKWGEHFMQNLSEGMHKGMPQLAATINAVASTFAATSSSLAGGIKIPLLTASPGLLASNIAEGILSKISVPQNRDPDWKQDMTHITLQLDSKTIADATLPRIAKEIHVQAGVRKL